VRFPDHICLLSRRWLFCFRLKFGGTGDARVRRFAPAPPPPPCHAARRTRAGPVNCGKLGAFLAQSARSYAARGPSDVCLALDDE